MTAVARKRVAVKARIASLDGELKQWTDASQAGQPLEKHNSQISRLTEQLTACGKKIEAELDGLTDDKLLAEAIYVEDKVLEVHRLWAYFRSKFEPRLVDWYRAFLRAADEFAWRCYQPIQAAAARAAVLPGAAPFDPAAVKEPPLVYLTGGWSPLVLSRGTGFLVEREPTARLIAAPAFYELTRRLPIPLVGVPWSQLSEAFDGVVLGHEVGHAVEDDFGLTGELDAAVSAVVPRERADAWAAWRREVFADWYGCLAAGPAFVGAITDMLARDGPAARAERQPVGNRWDRYPTAHLRVRLNLQFLRTLGFGAEADRRAADWPLGAADDHPLKAFEPDLEAVAGALNGETFARLGGATLPAVFRFSVAHYQAAVAAADALRGAIGGYIPVSKEGVRVLFAAGRLAFEADPAGFVADRLQEKVTTRVDGLIPAGLRAAPAAAAASDRKRGEKLFEELGQALGRATPAADGRPA